MNPLAEILDRALESPRGIRVKTSTYDEAISLRHRLYSHRTRDRRASRKLFEPNEPGFDASRWDGLMITLGDNELIISQDPSSDVVIEEL